MLLLDSWFLESIESSELKGLTAMFGMGTGRSSVNKLAPLLLTIENALIFRYARRGCQIAGTVSRSRPSELGANILCLLTTASVALPHLQLDELRTRLRSYTGALALADHRSLTKSIPVLHLGPRTDRGILAECIA